MSKNTSEKKNFRLKAAEALRLRSNSPPVTEETSNLTDDHLTFQDDFSFSMSPEDKEQIERKQRKTREILEIC